ncbi:hypothetical protein A1OW_12075 [Enterovibrio norvegicus]|uniref:Peptide methionine sulfoxide reductase n=1 Tax=Enterovibrio norvegicus TaxID=188144 RepID=A0ABV4KXW6_9GAMM|nr:hypothetical protein [Enterovibrio norvegicus]OEF49930.1 hypothetical protein A1OW_12075 [Enterovibrio norvegicus]OEF58465.1 hypothetical protein A1OU_09795 [Enterovibrio norvegicus]
MDAFLRISQFDAGHYDVLYQGERWGMSIRRYSSGKSVKVYAESLSSTDFISANMYEFDGRWVLKPCEMPDEKVLAFIQGFTV